MRYLVPYLKLERWEQFIFGVSGYDIKNRDDIARYGLSIYSLSEYIEFGMLIFGLITVVECSYLMLVQLVFRLLRRMSGKNGDFFYQKPKAGFYFSGTNEDFFYLDPFAGFYSENPAWLDIFYFVATSPLFITHIIRRLVSAIPMLIIGVFVYGNYFLFTRPKALAILSNMPVEPSYEQGITESLTTTEDRAVESKEILNCEIKFQVTTLPKHFFATGKVEAEFDSLPKPDSLKLKVCHLDSNVIGPFVYKQYLVNLNSPNGINYLKALVEISEQFYLNSYVYEQSNPLTRDIDYSDWNNEAVQFGYASYCLLRFTKLPSEMVLNILNYLIADDFKINIKLQTGDIVPAKTVKNAHMFFFCKAQKLLNTHKAIDIPSSDRSSASISPLEMV